MSGTAYDIKKVCEKCNSKMKAKTITINYWYTNSSVNAGVKTQTVAFCPNCETEPVDHIEHVGSNFDLF